MMTHLRHIAGAFKGRYDLGQRRPAEARTGAGVRFPREDGRVRRSGTTGEQTKL